MVGIKIRGKLILSFLFVLCAFSAFGQTTQTIRVKFTKEAVVSIQKNAGQLNAKGVVQSGISEVDALNSTFEVHKMVPLFAQGGKYAQRRKAFGLDLWYELEITVQSKQSLETAVAGYAQLGATILAEKTYEKKNWVLNETPVLLDKNINSLKTNSTFNDPRVSEQWHYNNTGQTSGTAGSDIDLFSAWDLETGSSDVIVSIQDGGVDFNHSDLAGNMWVNVAERDGTPGVDDDGNGYIDDVHGYNLADGQGTISPGNHGTHVAGTVAAVNNNGIGVAGVAGGSGSADGVRLMSVQVFSGGNGGFAESFAYAADNGAIISQNSWGYTSPGVVEQAVLDGIDYFIANAGYDENNQPFGPMQGGLVIFAAGNDNDNDQYYPGYYAPVLSVSATNHEDQKSWYSNYGEWVDVAAPGGETNSLSFEGVLSTLPNNNYGFYQGTSMACPHVSGLAALIVSKYGELGLVPDQVKTRILSLNDDIESLNPNYNGMLGSGRINALKALTVNEGIAPNMVTDLAASLVSFDGLRLTWTAPEDQDNEKASSYILKMSTSAINGSNFSAATTVGVLRANAAGVLESHAIENLDPTTQYYFALKSTDVFLNESVVSNIVAVQTTNPPAIEVTPKLITESLYTGESSTHKIYISNTGDGVLEFDAKLTFDGYQPSIKTVWKDPTFVGSAPSYKKQEPTEAKKDLYHSEFKNVKQDGIEQNNIRRSLEDVLSDLNSKNHEITESISGVYNFYDGFTGNEIVDGGNDMYDGGNHLGTNLGTRMYYTNGSIATSTALGGSAYFTAKYDGLFIAALNAENINAFNITGNLGADGGGSLDGTILQYSKGGKSFLGFVKRVYDAYDPSINHLVIVENSGSPSHSYYASTHYDDHQIENIESVTRVYYLLYAKTNGAYSSDEEVQQVMEKFLEIAEKTEIGILEPSSGAVAAGTTQELTLTLSADGLDAGQYLGTVAIESNVPGSNAETVALDLEVLNGPNIIIESETVNFEETFVGGSSEQVYWVTNNGNRTLNLQGVSTNQNEFFTDFTPSSINPGDTLRFNVSYAPVAIGNDNAEMTILSNDANSFNVKVQLTGVSIVPPSIDFLSEKIIEYATTSEIKDTKFYFQNNGGAKLSVNDVEVVLESGQNWLTTSDVSFDVEMEEVKTLNFRLNGTLNGAGTFKAKVFFHSNIPGASKSVEVEFNVCALAGDEIENTIGINNMDFENEVPYELNLDHYYTHSEGNQLTYQITLLTPQLGTMTMNGSTLSFVPSQIGAGKFELLVSDGGCAYKKEVKNFEVVEILAVEKQSDAVLQVFPNPIGNKISIQYQVQSKNKGNVVLALYDLNGKQKVEFINKKGIQPGLYNFEKTIGLPKGIYLLVLTEGAFKEVRKVVVK